MQGAGCFNRGF